MLHSSLNKKNHLESAALISTVRNIMLGFKNIDKLDLYFKNEYHVKKLKFMKILRCSSILN